MARKRGHDELALASTPVVSPAKRSRTTPPDGLETEPDGGADAADLAAETKTETSSDSDTTSSSSLSSEEEELSSEEEEDEEEDDDDEEDESDEETSSESSSSSSSSSSDENDDETDLENPAATSAALKGTGDANNNDNEQEDEPIPFVSGRPKPRIQRVQRSGLLSRLSSFLPRLKAANEDLERDIASGRAQDVVVDDVKDDEGQYIEMNLGLGVLEEKKNNGHDSDSEKNLEEGSEKSSTAAQEETHVLDRLMGNRAREKKQKPGIEEVD